MFQMRGKPVAAAYTMRAEEKQTGAPPHWNNYVTVADADESVKKAQSLGAKVFAPAFDVMDVGRMAVLQDPTGAVFQVWQPKKHIGAMIVNEPGTLCWTELTTSDLKRAEAFYTGLFGWTAKQGNAGGMEYTEMSNNGQQGVGMMPKPPGMPAHIPSYWMPYFMVTDVDADAAKAKQLGGKTMIPPQDIPNVGRFAIISDPQGAVFAIFKSARG
jgi:predicted enzyme related to lactoylglutathione lyase